MKVRKAIIPAAGFGTRFLPATKSIPKEMIPIVDKPSIQYIVEEAVRSGIEEILIVSGRYKDAMTNHFDRHPELESFLLEKGQKDFYEQVKSISDMASVHFIRQKQALGLGHAVLCAKAFVGHEPFAVMLGDDIVDSPAKPCLKQLIDAYAETGASVLGVQTVDRSQVSKYGIIDGKKIGERLFKVEGMVEKPAVDVAPSNVAIMGRYVLAPEIFEILETTKPGKGGEIQLTDGLVSLAKSQSIFAYDFEGKRYDTGDKLGYLKATVEYALMHPELAEGFRAYLKELKL